MLLDLWGFMKKFRLSWQFKVSVILLLVVNVPFIFAARLGMEMVENALLSEKENKLLSIAHVLDTMLGPKGFDGILDQERALAASREDKIKILNRVLSQKSDSIIPEKSALGVGYYSKELDAILAYGPSKLYQATVGEPIAEDHPGRQVMVSNAARVEHGTMVRGEIMNAMYPIEREGKVIGYIWANELEDDVQAQLGKLTRETLILLVGCVILTAVILIILSRRTVSDMNSVIDGVRQLKEDLSFRFPPMKGEFGDVVTSINDMAENVGKANEESARAISALQTVMNNMDLAIMVVDPKTRRLIYTNSYLQNLWNAHDIENSICYRSLYGYDEPCQDCPQESLFGKDGKPDFNVLHREEHNAVTDRDFLIADRLIYWHDGKVVHLRVLTDITDRNALALAQSAKQAQRDFLARMSHEIRTPMNGVLGMTRLAIQDNPPTRQLNYLNKIQSSASLLLGIINDILDFSRIEAGAMTIEKKTFDVLEAIEKVHELVLPRAKENHTGVNVVIDDTVPRYVNGDSLRFSQVLLNLAGNASKFTSHGLITIAVRAEPAERGKVRLYCRVADTGIGMTKQQQADLFTPFTQAEASTSRRFGGTGLGLSICKAFVELMGGHISVTSEEGAGSTFSFFVQFDEYVPVQGQDNTPDAPWKTAHYNGMRFLLVEDNAINQEVALAVLSEFGVTVDVANNGEEGYKMFLESDYDLILMDMRMPVMDGLEATRRIRASRKHDAMAIPVIAMTANAMEEDRQDSLEAGLNAHVSKPIDIDELKQVLYTYLVTLRTQLHA